MEGMVEKPKVVLASTCYRYRGITVDSANKGALVGAGGVAVGCLQEAIARDGSGNATYDAGKTVTLEPTNGEMYMEAGGAFTCGDFLKWTTGGKLIVETSATTRTANTVAIARQTAAGDASIVLVFMLNG